MAAGETRHRGEVVLAIEDALEPAELWRGESPAERAREVFARLRVWDTEENNGVLIHLLLADRAVEIVADRGVHARVGAGAWETICQRMEAAFRTGDFEAGTLAGIAAVSDLLTHEYPATPGTSRNELPNEPAFLR